MDDGTLRRGLASGGRSGARSGNDHQAEKSLFMIVLIFIGTYPAAEQLPILVRCVLSGWGDDAEATTSSVFHNRIRSSTSERMASFITTGRSGGDWP